MTTPHDCDGDDDDDDGADAAMASRLSLLLHHNVPFGVYIIYYLLAQSTWEVSVCACAYVCIFERDVCVCAWLHMCVLCVRASACARVDVHVYVSGKCSCVHVSVRGCVWLCACVCV